MNQHSHKEYVHTVAIFDLDSTITTKDTYLAFLINLLKMHPKRLFRCFSLPLAVFLFKLGVKDNSWLKETFLNSIAGGMHRNQINICVAKFLQNLNKKGIRSNALAAIKQHRLANHQLVLATASFDFYAEELGRQLGFDHVICTRSVWDGEDRLLGRIQGKNCYGPNKLERLQAHFGRQRENLYLIGYTDHHSDYPFLQWVDQPIAICPTTKLHKIARQQNFEVFDWDSEP